MGSSQYIYKLHPVRPEMLTQDPTEPEEEALQHHVTYT
jgi:hypothetical protein